MAEALITDDGWVSAAYAAELERVSVRTIQWRAKNGKYRSRTAPSTGGRPGIEIPLQELSAGARDEHLQNMETQADRELSEPDDTEDALPRIVEQGNSGSDGLDTHIGGRRTRARTRRNIAMIRDVKAVRAKPAEGVSLTEQLACVAQEYGVALGTLYRLERAERDKGNRGLVPRLHKPKRERDALDGPSREQIKAIYYLPNRLSAQECYERYVEIATTKWGVDRDELASYRTVLRYVQDLPADEVVYNREGGNAWRAKVCPRTRRDWTVEAPNSWWCSDHREFDVFCVDEYGVPVRLWLTATVDLRTKELCGWEIARGPNQDTIAVSLKHAIENKGLCEHLLVDRGRDYKSHFVSGGTVRSKNIRCAGMSELCRDVLLSQKKEVAVTNGGDETGRPPSVAEKMGVQMHFAQPRSPWSKPIESWFGMFAPRFERKLPGWCGRDNKDRPEKLPREIKEGELISIPEFKEAFEQYAIAFNVERELECLNGQTPQGVRDAYENGLLKIDGERWVPFFPDPEDLKFMTWRCKRVTIRTRGMNLMPKVPFFPSDQLMAHDGQKAWAYYDPSNAGTAEFYACTEKDSEPSRERPLGVAYAYGPKPTGESEADVKEVIRYQKRKGKEVRRQKESMAASVSYAEAKRQLEESRKPKGKNAKIEYAGPRVTKLNRQGKATEATRVEDAGPGKPFCLKGRTPEGDAAFEKYRKLWEGDDYSETGRALFDIHKEEEAEAASA